MSSKALAIRRSNGQFASAERDNLNYELMEPASPRFSRGTPRKSTPTGSFAKSALRIVLSGRKDEVHAVPTETLTRDCSTIYWAAKLLFTTIGLCHSLSQIAKGLVFAYFLFSIFTQGTLYNLAIITSHCMLGRGQNFYPRVMTAIFPAEIAEISPNLQIILRESALIGAQVVVDANFAISINNLAVQLVVLVLLVANSFVLACLQSLLAKIARLARDGCPDRDLELKYGPAPG